MTSRPPELAESALLFRVIGKIFSTTGKQALVARCHINAGTRPVRVKVFISKRNSHRILQILDSPRATNKDQLGARHGQVDLLSKFEGARIVLSSDGQT